MRDRITIVACRFYDRWSGDEGCGYRIFDEHSQTYENAFESVPANARDLVRAVFASNVKDVQRIVEYVKTHEAPITIESTFYSYEKICEMLEEESTAAESPAVNRVRLADIAKAIDQFLRFGEGAKGESHEGYYSKGGWAYETLAEHARELESLMATEEESPIPLTPATAFPQFNIEGTTTGRFSSEKPNLSAGSPESQRWSAKSPPGCNMRKAQPAYTVTEWTAIVEEFLHNVQDSEKIALLRNVQSTAMELRSVPAEQVKDLLRNVRGLADMQGVTERAELHAALTDIDEECSEAQESWELEEDPGKLGVAGEAFVVLIVANRPDPLGDVYSAVALRKAARQHNNLIYLEEEQCLVCQIPAPVWDPDKWVHSAESSSSKASNSTDESSESSPTEPTTPADSSEQNTTE